MEKIEYDAKYFNPLHTLECGQIFRFKPYKDGFFVVSGGEACYLSSDGKTTVAECTNGQYFYDFFDLGRDYSEIVSMAKSFNVPLLTRGAEAFCGLRLLNQQKEEMIYSFIISQNNNIPRIKGIIGRICDALGEKRQFGGVEYSAFPTSAALAGAGKQFFRQAGCGYRDEYLAETSKRIASEGVDGLCELPTPELKKALLQYKGVGGKVADCISLFGFSRRDAFPVDTWLEKVYLQDFGGKPAGREQISRYFCGLFGQNSGYVQQYLFYGKRQNL